MLIILALLIMIYSFITNRTIAGRHIYALGGNAKAAKLSGIKTENVLFWVYVNMGVLAALLVWLLQDASMQLLQRQVQALN